MTVRLGMLRLRLAWLRLAARSWSQTSPDPALPAIGLPVDLAPDELSTQAHPEPRDLVAAAYESFQREIHSFAVHATRDPEVAADVTHEAFLKLLLEAQADRTPDNIRAWLYRVASNLILNRARHAHVADRVRRAWSGGEDAEASPEWLALRSERVAELRLALARLPRDARIALLLAANGFSGREVAAAIGRSDLATRTLLSRARGQLREQLPRIESPA